MADAPDSSMRSLSKALVAAGGGLVWVTAIKLVDTYGLLSIGIGVLYVISVGVVFGALAMKRDLGLFVAGGFVAGCGGGVMASLSQLLFAGIPTVPAMAGLLLGALGTSIACIPVNDDGSQTPCPE